MFDLPQELIDRFIDEFHDSNEDLKALSLVSRSWLHHARYHLFRSLALMPQDFTAMREHYDDVKYKASLPSTKDPDLRLTLQDENFLRSPLAGNPQSTQAFLSSIATTLPYVRGLRLLSFVQVGNKLMPARNYLQGWLGYGGDECAVRRKARWESLDLPWGRGSGLHALPFRNLRFLYIQWSVFSWTPPSEGSINPDDWPGYQLAMLISSNANTLDQVYVDEYPGFQLVQRCSSPIRDALLDLLAKNAPNLQSLCLGGLREPFYMSFSDNIKPEGSDNFLIRDRALYPAGEKIPHVMRSDYCLPMNSPSISLQRLYIEGFDPESTTLLEGAILNRGIFSLQNLTHLALSVMPKGYNYMFMFSQVQGSLTHLSLDLNLGLRLLSAAQVLFLPKAGMLTAHDGSRESVVQVVKLLHISFGFNGPLVDPIFLTEASIDELLENLVCTDTELPESMGRTQVEGITFKLRETLLAETLPRTYRTGRLKSGNTNYWWYQPDYLKIKVEAFLSESDSTNRDNVDITKSELFSSCLSFDPELVVDSLKESQFLITAPRVGLPPVNFREPRAGAKDEYRGQDREHDGIKGGDGKEEDHVDKKLGFSGKCANLYNPCPGGPLDEEPRKGREVYASVSFGTDEKIKHGAHSVLNRTA
ncbi:hypothetical protein EV361DRAFT_1007462 [Lentinula raphanica]|nr:hypothetical protein EV361DRAFT_1007462 [Lentinula raphanica]